MVITIGSVADVPNILLTICSHFQNSCCSSDHHDYTRGKKKGQVSTTSVPFSQESKRFPRSTTAEFFWLSLARTRSHEKPQAVRRARNRIPEVTSINLNKIVVLIARRTQDEYQANTFGKVF